MVKDVFRQPDEQDNPLVSTGAAAGLAATFNAPLSGVIFVMEEMHDHFRFTFHSVAAIMLGATVADLVCRSLIDERASIAMRVITDVHLNTFWLFAALGVLFSLVGALYNKLLVQSLDLAKRLRIHPFLFAAIIGAVVGLVGFYQPDMIGAGYDTITKVLNGSFGLQLLLLILGVRFVLSIASYSTGAPGGIFAPLITLGLIFGMSFGLAVQPLFPGLFNDPAIFAVAGIAGIFAATVRAPLTGVALAVEMTANYELIAPIMLTSICAAVVTNLLGNGPIYSILLKRTLELDAKVVKVETERGIGSSKEPS